MRICGGRNIALMHERIAISGEDCPLCRALDERQKTEKEAMELRAKIIEMERIYKPMEATQ